MDDKICHWKEGFWVFTQKRYIRIASIPPIWEYIRNAHMNELSTQCGREKGVIIMRNRTIQFLRTILFYISIFIFVPTAFAGTNQLPQTGQTKCYDTTGAEIPCAGTGQDGEIQVGVAWPEPRFTDHGMAPLPIILWGLCG